MGPFSIRIYRTFCSWTTSHQLKYSRMDLSLYDYMLLQYQYLTICVSCSLLPICTNFVTHLFFNTSTINQSINQSIVTIL